MSTPSRIPAADIKKAAEAHTKPVIDALKNGGYETQLFIYYSWTEYDTKGEITVASKLREHWSCSLCLHYDRNSGAIQRVIVTAKPAPVVLKYTENTISRLLERVAASFQADIDSEARRSQRKQHAAA